MLSHVTRAAEGWLGLLPTKASYADSLHDDIGFQDSEMWNYQSYSSLGLKPAKCHLCRMWHSIDQIKS